MNSIADLLSRLRTYGPRECLTGAAGGRTYSELLEEIGRWHTRLDEFRVAPLSVIGLRCDYSFSAIAALLALLERRSIVAMIPRDRDSAQYLLDAHASALLEFDAESRHTLRRLAAPEAHPLIERLRSSGDGGIVLFTSGSTGPPKAAVRSVERLLSTVRTSGTPLRTLAFMVFDHVGGLDTVFHVLATGGTLVITTRRDPLTVLNLLVTHRVEAMPASPSFLRLLCATDLAARQNLPDLKVIAYSSEPMDPTTLERLNARFPNVRITQKYGTTETGVPRSISRSNDSLWFKVKEGVETSIRDGVLWIRSDGAILGYLNAPSPIETDGWYCTGDLVDVDGDWIKIRGRQSDIINVGGEKVSPVEVEQLILQLPFVRDAVVSGEPHPLMGQVVTAKVSLKEDLDPKEALTNIRLHCREHLAPYKIPVKMQITSESFTNARHKAQRNSLAT